jgi:hypothetical protein
VIHAAWKDMQTRKNNPKPHYPHSPLSLWTPCSPVGIDILKDLIAILAQLRTWRQFEERSCEEHVHIDQKAFGENWSHGLIGSEVANTFVLRSIIPSRHAPWNRKIRNPSLPVIHSSSTSWCRPRTFRLNSSGSFSHSSAASPFNGDALIQINNDHVPRSC